MAASAKTHDFLDPPTEPGDIGLLGHYRVIGELGKGGMGYVFRAEDIKLKRAVALKVMNKKIAATPNSRRRFIHEARAMAAVHHDNVATIFEVGESNSTPFMAMEMLKGCTLEDFNKKKTQLGFETVIEYAKQLARGLAAAHAKGIVHRDIKPANIWIEEGTDRIKILDFGLALASTPVDHLAGRGAVIGTPGYLSPEQARSEPLDDRSDLYSLGVVLYELCTGQLPILAKSVPGQLISILAHRPTPINEVNPEIPQPLCDLVHRLLRKEPRTRPSSAVVLEQDLDRVENECHAKSEVAQAINKLQAGLSEVVSKKSSDEFFGAVDSVQESIPNPLAVPAATPVAMIPPARPIGTAAKRNGAVKKSSAGNQPAWKTYWPIAAAVGLLVIMVPILAFMLAVPKRENTTVITQANRVPTNQNNQSKPNTQQPAQPKQRNNDWKNGNNANKEKKAGNKPWQKKANQNGSSAAKPSNIEKPAPPVNKPNVVNKPAVEPTNPAMATIETNSVPTTSNALTADFVWTTIGTDEGRGADALVQKGTNSKQGMKPNVGIGSRKNVETHHTYLRFDLATIENVQSYVHSAELMLAFVGKKMEKTGTEVRVLGISTDQLWPEKEITWKNSFSSNGTEALPLLAEVTVDANSVTKFDGRRVLRISSPELAQFVKASGDTMTLLMTANTLDDEPMRFVSRDNPAGNSPKLRVEVPSSPPENKKKKGRR